MAVSIRKFTLIWICFGSAVLITSYIMLNSILLTDTFSHVAYNFLANNTARVANFLGEEVQKLDEITVDWAIWDDSYLFMQNKKPSFIKSNLNDRTLNSLDLSFIAFVNNQGEIIWSSSRKDDDSFAPQIADAVRDIILNKTAILSAETQDGRVHGLAKLDGAFAIITSCPISDSEGAAPKQGTIIMGRDITEEIKEKIEEKTRLKFVISDQFDSSKLGELVHTEQLKTKSEDFSVKIYDTSDSTLSGYAKIKDISGVDSIDLIVSGDKEILELGLNASHKSSIILISGGIALIGCILFLIERKVLSRILSIKSQITETNRNINALSARKEIRIPGNDELSELAHYINIYIAEIMNYKLNLENLVEERTKSLQEKNLENERIRQKLEQAKLDAEKANSTKTDFLAKVTHEIRTPMNAIKGMNDYLLSTAITNDQHECLTAIKESSDHLLTIVNDLLDLSKIEAGKVALEQIDFNVKGLIESTTRLMTPLANKKHIEIITSLDSSADIVVQGDPSRIRQILLNLINNALKFTKIGHISIHAAAKKDTTSERYDVTITVSDTGVGIEKAILDSIFEPFNQGDNSTSRKFGGTGLGLSVCKQLVSLMHGKISVSSKPGAGSKFTVRLPLNQGDYNHICADTQDTNTLSTTLDRLMILVVDDNDMNLRVAKKVFSLINQEPIVAHDAKEALSFLKTALFDIVFLDIEMPEINGIELCKIIRAGTTTPLNKDVYITAMTAYSLDTIKDECLNCGMDDFITKPLDPKVLYEKLLMLHQGRAGYCHYTNSADDTPQNDAAPSTQSNRLTLNSELALQKLGGDNELYLEVCEGYIESHNTEKIDITLIQAMPEADKLLFEIHSLKGITQQIGAEKLSAVAEGIEKKLKNQGTYTKDELLKLKDTALETEKEVLAFLQNNRPKPQ